MHRIALALGRALLIASGPELFGVAQMNNAGNAYEKPIEVDDALAQAEQRRPIFASIA